MSTLTASEKRMVDKLASELAVVVQPEPLLVALVTIIRRTDRELVEKKAEFVRMENAWRGEVEKLRRQLYARRRDGR